MSDDSVSRVINHPATAIVLPAANTVAGHLISAANIQSWLTVISLSIGIVISLVLLRNHIIKGKLLQRQLELAMKENSSKGDIDEIDS